MVKHNKIMTFWSYSRPDCYGVPGIVESSPLIGEDLGEGDTPTRSYV
jgi:hypothetical protein